MKTTLVFAIIVFAFSFRVESNFNMEEVDPLYFGSSDKTNFVMRWQYQNFCDHVFDPRIDEWRWPTDKQNGVTFNPKDVKPGDTIFIRMFPEFFEQIHPLIEHPYIIVSAGECLDKMIDSYKPYLEEEKVIAWFGVHPNKMAMEHSKFHPLPLGILQDPQYYRDRKRLNAYFKRLRTTTEKKYLLYMNFAYSDEKPDRIKLRKRFLGRPYCKKGERKEFKDYLHEMAQSKFILSPEGLGPDCYRTWESFLVGSIPVVIRSPLDTLFSELPILIIDSWDQLTEEFLLESYEKICSKKYDIQRLYSDYWTNQIVELQRRFREDSR